MKRPDPVPTCEIRWVDATGNPTPDNSPAIGEAWVSAHVSNAGGGHPHQVPESKHFPICAWHARRLTDRGMEYWRFDAYETEEGGAK